LSLKFAKGQYNLKNPEKYIGSTVPIYRSSWEVAVMRMCDNNPAIQQWASEPVRIPYRDPLTGKQTVYVPDFLVMFEDKKEKKHVELWEIKPANQTALPLNEAKWAACQCYCESRGWSFIVVTEVGIGKLKKRTSEINPL
jgi:hypothetical protein